MKNKMDSNNVFKLVLAAVFCALVFTTTFISIPAPTIGNINLGDCVIIICACTLGGVYAVFAGSLGAALCDLISGYGIYAPGTLVVKALMVIMVLLLRKFILKSNKPNFLILSGVCAELVMVIGYFVFESLVLGYGLAAIVNVPFNLIQGTLNLVVAIMLYTLLQKAGIVKMLTEAKPH